MKMVCFCEKVHFRFYNPSLICPKDRTVQPIACNTGYR